MAVCTECLDPYCYADHLGEAEAEARALRAENERLKSALRGVLGPESGHAWWCNSTQDPDLDPDEPGTGCATNCRNARRALGLGKKP